MRLSDLRLFNFKNYISHSLNFKAKTVAFTGKNGTGKTNLLDAIYYLCIGKSYFNSVEANNVHHNASFLRLEGKFIGNEAEAFIEATYERNGKKKISKNGVVYDKLFEHIGQLPVTFIAPDDNQIVLSASDQRRRFVNSSISQLNVKYLKDVLQYRKILTQRNTLLKADNLDEKLLDTYDEQLIPLAQNIYTERKHFVEVLSPQIKSYYRILSAGSETVNCLYASNLNELSMADLLAKNRDRDLMLKRTTGGIHRDDLQFTIDGKELKRFGSQGQQKSYLLSLKLAQSALLKKILQKDVILLIDDAFDKLDEARAEKLFEIIAKAGQVFISDTNTERVKHNLSKFTNDFEIIDTGIFAEVDKNEEERSNIG